MEDDVSLQICVEPRPRAVFLKAVVVSVFERTSVPHDQRRAVASAFRSSTLVIFLLERDQQKLDDRRQVLVLEAGDCILRDHAVVHVVLGQEDRRRSRSPPQPRRQSHLSPPRFRPQHVWWKLNTGGLGSRVLRPNRWWQPSDRVK